MDFPIARWKISRIFSVINTERIWRPPPRSTSGLFAKRLIPNPNSAIFNAAFGNYSWASKEEKGYATYSVYLGNPAIRGAAFLDPNDKRPLIMKANLASATEADAMISSFNESLDDIVKQKKDLNDAITESSQQNASTQVGDINQSKTYQMIVLANVLRARSKLYTIDALKERNRLMAMRVLSLSQRNREGVFEKYKQAAIINE